MTLTEFLLARIAEDEAAARSTTPFEPTWDARPDETGQPIKAGKARIATCAISVMDHIARHDPARVLAECEAKRRIVELHKSWPVLVEGPSTLERVDNADPTQFAFHASRQIAWMTQQEYRARFGDEPPTAPMLAALALPYADHPDYNQEWKP